jgi:hypothetical protein
LFAIQNCFSPFWKIIVQVIATHGDMSGRWVLASWNRVARVFDFAVVGSSSSIWFEVYDS